MESIKALYPLEDEIRTLVAQANFDLYAGPCQEEGFPGFETACKRIRKALSNVSDVYEDRFCGYFTESEPQGFEDEDGEWIEPTWEDWFQHGKRDVLAALVGSELAPYVA